VLKERPDGAAAPRCIMSEKPTGRYVPSQARAYQLNPIKLPQRSEILSTLLTEGDCIMLRR
jgi:hypothetical protein